MVLSVPAIAQKSNLRSQASLRVAQMGKRRVLASGFHPEQPPEHPRNALIHVVQVQQELSDSGDARTCFTSRGNTCQDSELFAAVTFPLGSQKQKRTHHGQAPSGEHKI